MVLRRLTCLLATSLIIAALLPACAGHTVPSGLTTTAGASESPAAALTWTKQAGGHPPTARHESALVALDGKLYLLGGRGERPLEIFDPASGRWTRGARPPLDQLHHAQALAYNGRIWVLGALTGDFPAEPAVPTLWIYDPTADAWQPGPPLPAGRARGASGVALHAGRIYLVGGVTRGHTGGVVPWLDVFDPATERWTALPDAPHARDHFHAAVLDGALYAAGGRVSAHGSGASGMQSVAAVDMFDIASGRWSTLPSPLPTPRSGTATVVWNDRLVVIGGESDAHTIAHAQVEAWNPATQRWEALPPLPVGRHGMQAAVLDGALHVVAGSGNRGGGPELDDHYRLVARP